jgi:hypothetical protein
MGFVAETQCVSREVRTEFLYIFRRNSVFKVLSTVQIVVSFKDYTSNAHAQIRMPTATVKPSSGASIEVPANSLQLLRLFP